jgi:hypothetical protein
MYYKKLIKRKKGTKLLIRHSHLSILRQYLNDQIAHDVLSREMPIKATMRYTIM